MFHVRNIQKPPPRIQVTSAHPHWGLSGFNTLIRSEASTCRASIRAAKNIVADIGEKFAQRSKGLVELSKCTEEHSERDVQSVVKQFDLMLPLQLTSLPKQPGTRYTGEFKAIRLRDWCQFLVDYNCWHVVCGLREPDENRECAILAEFWRRFQLVEPDHQIFAEFAQHRIDPSRCCPMLLHGDEGRGRKKCPFLVVAFHSFIGFGTQAANRSRTHRSYRRMRLNYSETTHVHRFITAVLPKMVKDDVALKTILSFVTAESLHTLRHGVSTCHGGQRYHMAVLNVTGDWAWLAKAGCLSRSYSNCEKRPRGARSQPKGICHLCRAGQLNVPFEDFNRDATWKSTMLQRGDNPFASRPALAQLPHRPNKEATLFKYDLWHSLHLGFGKTLSASILTLISDRMSANNVDDRFTELSDEFFQYCDESRITPYINVITKETVGWPNRATYPNGFWSKGHVTVTLLKFIAHWLHTHDVSDSAMLTTCIEAVDSLNACMEDLYRQDIWISQAIARPMGEKGLRCLELYQGLARHAYDAGEAQFAFMPKGHVVHHVFDELAQSGIWILNPLCFSVQVSEDYIGRKSRLARRVAPAQVIQRVLERSLQVGWKHWTQMGFIKGWRRWRGKEVKKSRVARCVLGLRVHWSYRFSRLSAFMHIKDTHGITWWHNNIFIDRLKIHDLEEPGFFEKNWVLPKNR